MLAPDLVEEHCDAYARLRFCDQRLLKSSPQAVIAQDIELDQEIIPRRLDAFEDRAKGRLTVD